jgi:threonine/homoserine/homoserine lactone efflux protein
MTALIFSAFITGFIVAIPPGAVTVAAGQRAVRNGFRDSMIFCLGSCLADIIYLLIVYFGVAVLIADNHILKTVLYFLSSGLLLFFGISTVRDPRGMQLKEERNGKKSGILKTILSGLGITLLNPATIAGWIAIGGNFFLMWNKKMPGAEHLSILLIPVIMLGVMAWFGPLLFGISRLKHVMKEKTMKILIIGTGIFLIGFGGMSLFYGIRELLNHC